MTHTQDIAVLTALRDEHVDSNGYATQFPSRTPEEIAALNSAIAHFTALEASLTEKTAECEEDQASLNLYYDALMRGTKIWWEAHPDQAYTLPDTANMMAWFVDSLEGMTEIASQRLAHETKMRIERDTALADLATAREECERLRNICRKQVGLPKD